MTFSVVVRTARDAGITVYHVPHHRWEPGDYVNWKYPSPYQLGAAERQAFAKDTWGGTFHDDFQVQPGDVVATEHWASSGFSNTDLGHKLKRYGKEKIICERSGTRNRMSQKTLQRGASLRMRPMWRYT